MTAFRSLLFNLLFYLNLLAFLILGSVFFFTPRAVSVAALKVWARTCLWLLRITCGTKISVRGLENIPTGACLIAAKHQSMWETFAILPFLADPAIVLKRELCWIPFFGWYAYKFRMIAVDRSGGSAALKTLVADARTAAAARRQIVIFPEGSRKEPGAAPDYKPGVAALYGQLGIACVPMALNSGLFWPKHQFRRYPGTIIMQFLPPLPAGLPRRVFSQQMETAIEAATQDLAIEAQKERESHAKH